MTRKEALQALLESIEVGDLDLSPNAPAHVVFSNKLATVWKAYSGSLDAALALHKAVLPGWHVADMCETPPARWSVELHSRAAIPIHDGPIGTWALDGDATTPARAWLIAILRALIAEASE